VSDLSAIYGADLLTWRDSRDASSGTLVTWPDRVGGGPALGTISGTPTGSAFADLNNLNAVACNGTTDAFTIGLDRPVPSLATPTVFIVVFKQRTWTAGDIIWATGSNILQLAQVSVTPAVVPRNGVSGPANSTMALDTWRMVVVQYANDTSDFVQVGQSAATTGTATGVTDPGANIAFGSRPGAVATSDVVFGTISIVQRIPSAGDLTATRAFFNSFYPPGVTA
jgi:hypothetical protein